MSANVKTFLLDVWHDLSQKRLGYAAIGLAIALVAVPVALFFLSPDAVEPEPSAQAPGAGAPAPSDGLPKLVALTDGSLAGGSHLGTFDKKDPFDDNGAIAAAQGPGSGDGPGGLPGLGAPVGAGGPSSLAAGGLPGGGPAGGGGPSFGPPSQGGSPSSGSPRKRSSSKRKSGSKPDGKETPDGIVVELPEDGKNPAGSPPGGGNGSSPSSGGGGSSSDSDSADADEEFFTFTVDVTFEEEGNNPDDIDGVRQFDLIPDDRNPRFIFQGVTEDGDSAVFSVIGNVLSESGDGDCEPGDDDRCVFIELEEGDEHSFTLEDGSEFTLELRDIDEEKVERDRGVFSAAAKSFGRPGSGPSLFELLFFTDQRR